MDLDKRIEDVDLSFLDLETTGLDVVTGDTICEIGVLKVRNREVADKFHSLINPGKRIPPQAYNIHKISNEEVKDAPRFEEVAESLVSFLRKSVVCAYNVEFDMGFIKHQLKKTDYIELGITAIDILSMARDVLDLPRYNLEATANSFNIECGCLHRALDDAAAAYKVFFKLIDIFKEKGVEKLGDFVSLYGISNESFKLKEDNKMILLEKAVEEGAVLKIRYFSSAAKVVEEKMTPLKILRENKYFYLWCQGLRAQESQRIKLNRILDIEA